MKTPQLPNGIEGSTPLGIKPEAPLSPNMEKFLAAYEVALTEAHAKHPQDYGFPADQLPVVFGRMKAAIIRNSYNFQGHAFKAACKTLGIKHTRTAIEAFIRA